MIATVVAVVLLVFAASLGSWFLSRWFAGRERIPGTMIVVGGAGIVLLVFATGLTIIAAPPWWQSLLRSAESLITRDSARSVVPDMGPAASESDTGLDDAPLPASGPADARRAASQGDASAIRRRRDFSQYDEPADETSLQPVSTERLGAAHPTTSGAADVADFMPLLKNWSATECVKSKPSDDQSRWLLDNECSGVVAVVFAWCERSACDADIAASTNWRYEPAGIVMTTLQQRLSPRRLMKDGPLIAPTYILRQTAELPRIRYLACNVANAEVLAMLEEPSDAPDDVEFAKALRADECYGRVMELSRAGQRSGRSLETLPRL